MKTRSDAQPESGSAAKGDAVPALRAACQRFRSQTTVYTAAAGSYPAAASYEATRPLNLHLQEQ